GSYAAVLFSERGYEVVGVDNDLRSRFFGPSASVAARREQLIAELPHYRHVDFDIRDGKLVDQLFAQLAEDGGCHAVIHTAAQPSHDWAAREPMTDFTVNALATLNMLEAVRRHCP